MHIAPFIYSNCTAPRRRIASRRRYDDFDDFKVFSSEFHIAIFAAVCIVVEVEALPACPSSVVPLQPTPRVIVAAGFRVLVVSNEPRTALDGFQVIVLGRRAIFWLVNLH